IGNDAGGVGYGTKEPIQLRDDDDNFGFYHGGEELAACGTSCERLATTDSRGLQDLGQAESLHGAVGGDAVTLGLESKAAIGLFFARDADVADGLFHGPFSILRVRKKAHCLGREEKSNLRQEQETSSLEHKDNHLWPGFS